MRKLSLEIESLDVESFETAGLPSVRGTAFAHDASHACADPDPEVHADQWPEKPPPAGTAYPEATCYGTCYFSCGCSI